MICCSSSLCSPNSTQKSLCSFWPFFYLPPTPHPSLVLASVGKRYSMSERRKSMLLPGQFSVHVFVLASSFNYALVARYLVAGRGHQLTTWPFTVFEGDQIPSEHPREHWLLCRTSAETKPCCKLVRPRKRARQLQ